jgi:hypothetical protein
MRPSGSLAFFFPFRSWHPACLASLGIIMDSPKRHGPTEGFAPLVPELDMFDS